MSTRTRCINPDCPKPHEDDVADSGRFAVCPSCGQAMATIDAGDSDDHYPETRLGHDHEPHWAEIDLLSKHANEPPPIPPVPWNLADGSIFAGRYKILRKLGQGGMGAVYLAHDGNLERVIALKIPSLAGAGPDFVKRFFREARAMAQLMHSQNICKVIDVVNPFNSVPYLILLSRYVRS
jgi:Protein kinase domain